MINNCSIGFVFFVIITQTLTIMHVERGKLQNTLKYKLIPLNCGTQHKFFLAFFLASDLKTNSIKLERLSNFKNFKNSASHLEHISGILASVKKSVHSFSRYGVNVFHIMIALLQHMECNYIKHCCNLSSLKLHSNCKKVP